MPKIYIIIVTYNAMKWAERCFSSIIKSSIPLHTIVVDNGSTDGTQDYIQTNFPKVQFIQSDTNLGFGKANNLAIEIAYKHGADFFYLMNQDAWLLEDTIENLLEVYDEKLDIGILSPIHIDGSEQNLDIFFERYLARNTLENRLFSEAILHKINKIYEVDFINAAHWFIPKKIIENIGGFNPYFFHYGEDREFTNRLKFHKYNIFVVPNSKSVHDREQNLNRVSINFKKLMLSEIEYINPIIPFSYKKFVKKYIYFIINTLLFLEFKISYSYFEDFFFLNKKMKQFSKIRSEVKKIQPNYLKLN